MTVGELKARLDQEENKSLILDVREPWELKVCALPGTLNIPMRVVPLRVEELDRDREIVVMCHHGIRSYQVAYFLQNQGFEHIYNLQGGIDAWAKAVDPQVPTY